MRATAATLVSISSGPKFALHKLDGPVFRLQTPFELRVLHSGKNLLEPGAGPVTHSDQVVSRYERCWPDAFWRHGNHLFAHQIVGTKITMAALAVKPMQFQVLLKAGQAQKSFQ